tara:strand:- start:843 stop:1538 length:696 start_codon:yes stop_codon:yes gene_type:complete
MPVVKKPKRAKKTKKPRGRRVATAPTRDVIINIQTSKPRARRQLVKKTAPRSEDLGGRIKDYETAQAQFRQTDLIRSQAKQIGLLDKRLSVLTDVIDNERNKPLVQKQPASIPKTDNKTEREVGAVMEGLLMGVELQAKTEEIEEEIKEKRPRARRRTKAEMEEERQRKLDIALMNPVEGVPITPQLEQIAVLKPREFQEGSLLADLEGAVRLPQGKRRGSGGGAEEGTIL